MKASALITALTAIAVVSVAGCAHRKETTAAVVAPAPTVAYVEPAPAATLGAPPATTQSSVSVAPAPAPAPAPMVAQASPEPMQPARADRN